MADRSINMRPPSAGLNSSKLNSSKIKFADEKLLSKTKVLDSVIISNAHKSKTKNLNDSANASMTKTSVKKPIIEYNAIGNVPVESEKTTLYSTWTPLSDEQTNNKVCEFK